MPSAKALLLAGFFTLTSVVRGHFYITGFTGDNKEFKWESNSPVPSDRESVGWHSDSYANAAVWVNQDSYKTSDIACGKNYRPGNAHAKIAAGEELTVRWTKIPAVHRGPILDYLAPCPGSCTGVDPAQLKFTKFAQTGLVTPKEAPNPKSGPVGVWATDLLFRTAEKVIDEFESGPDLVAGIGVYWKVRIPGYFAPGFYVWREEIVGIFGEKDVTQHYPRCINIEITGSGTEKPEGVLASDLYDPNEPGITARIYENLDNYTMPGPAVYSGTGGAQAQVARGGASSSSASSITSTASSPSSSPSGSPSGDGGSYTPDTTSVSRTQDSSGSRTSPTSDIQDSVRATSTPSGNDACVDGTTVTVTSTVTASASASSGATSYGQPSTTSASARRNRRNGRGYQ